MSTTYIDDVEAAIDEVAQWANDSIETAYKALAPNGRPFFQDLKSEEEQKQEYLLLRGNVEGWMIWLQDKRLQIAQKIMSSGVSVEIASMFNPDDLAITFAVDYCIRMEKLIRGES